MNIPPPDQATRLLELERAEIGHEIHDALLPLIFAASAGVSRLMECSNEELASDVNRERIRQVADWLHEAMHTGRRLLTDVYPPELVGTVWTRAAKDTLQRLFGESDTRLDWKLDSSVDQTEQAIAVAAYRIVVEATRNAITHGKASDVQIAGEGHGEGILISIRDNGTGFDSSHVPNDRFGIRSMMGRAQLVGGLLTVDSVIGEGTTVTFVSHPSAPH